MYVKPTSIGNEFNPHKNFFMCIGNGQKILNNFHTLNGQWTEWTYNMDRIDLWTEWTQTVQTRQYQTAAVADW